MNRTLDAAVREAAARVIAALAARYRDLDIAEEAFAEACVRAAKAWPNGGCPDNPAAWLYRAADRSALDILRKRRVRESFCPDPVPPEPSPEDAMFDDAALIPDDRLRLIFICCHPAVAPEVRAQLTLRLVCGLSTEEIARAFLMAEPTLAQRLVRAKRKIAEAGVPFQLPAPELWADRLEAVLTTLEVAYSKAHSDAAGAGPHAGYAAEMLSLTRLLASLLPSEPEALAFAALVRYAEARRPGRLQEGGMMVPLSEQDPALWRTELIEEASRYFERSAALGQPSARFLQAALHAAWCGRKSLADPPPWGDVLAIYNALLRLRDDPIIRLNRAVALAEVEGIGAALEEVEALDSNLFSTFLPYHAVRGDLLPRAGQASEAREAYDRALALEPRPAERLWLEKQQAAAR
jgi:RNA polymerase sigma-70 factor (ECF subfamily)